QVLDHQAQGVHPDDDLEDGQPRRRLAEPAHEDHPAQGVEGHVDDLGAEDHQQRGPHGGSQARTGPRTRPAITARARSMSSRFTSLWVTNRTRRRSTSRARTPASARRRENSGAGATADTSHMTMLVWTRSRSTWRGGRTARPSARRRALAWSSARRWIISSRATRPAAAMTPAWRMPPPSSLRQRRARAMNSPDPQSMEPMGAPRPLDRLNITESAGAARS